MKSVPFLISTVLAFLCVVLSLVSFSGGQGNNSMQRDLLQKQNAIQELTTEVTLKNQDFQRQAQIIEAGAQVDQKLGPPILRDIGFLAAKNKNKELKSLLLRYKFESFNLTDEQLQEVEKQMEKSGVKPPAATPAPAPKPAGSTTPAPTPAPSPAPAPGPAPSPTLRP